MAAITTTYYTLNDCCTGQPYTVNNQILCFIYTGLCELGTCPQDLLPLIITSISSEATPDYITGCFNLTQVQSVPPGAITTNYITAIASVNTVPTCADCQDCPVPTYYTFNDCCTNEPFRQDGKILVFEYQTGVCEPGACPANMEGLIITALYPECVPPCVPVVEGCFNLTVINTPPVESTVVDWFVIADFDSVRTCVQCQTCPVYYTLNDCCTNQPINWPANEAGIQGTLYLEFDGVSCNEGDFGNLPCPNDLTNLVITEIVNEAQLNITGCLKLTSVLITEIPGNAGIADWQDIMSEVTTVPTCAECQECCYKLTNCQTNEVIYSNSNTLIQHFGNTVTLNGQEGCWEVGISSGICECINVTFVGPGGTDTYAANSIGTFNGATLYQFTANNGEIDILYIWFVGGEWIISANGYGEDPAAVIIATVKFDGECPDSVNEGFTWIPREEIDTIQTEVCPAECTCPVPVTVLQSYPTCEECLPVIAYKFTNCNNQSLVKYSIEDYSAYVGKTVELECGNCWFVSQIDYTPPSTQTITILYTFDSCLACNRKYYKLVDCLDPNINIIYTYTDVSQYLGKTIKIKNCNDCFTVLEETRQPINPGVVEVTDSYIDCPECLGTFPCVCTKVSNTTNTEQTYCYIDCDFNQQSVTLLPGESSDKICVIEWIGCPQETCECLEGAYTKTNINSGNQTKVTYKFEKTKELKNGKPVYNGYLYFSDDLDAYVKYKLSYEIDNCWYVSTDIGADSFPVNGAPVFKLCTDSNCPVGDWEYIECGCIRCNLSSEQTDLAFTVTITELDTNGYFIYQNPDFIISYNAALGRWELYEKNPLKLIAYSIATTTSCPIITNVKEAWVFVQPSMYIEFSTGPCYESNITHTYNTIECQIQCECFTIDITYDDFYGVPGLTFTGIPILSGNTINGKPEYIFNTGVDSIFYIYWDSETNCWILSNSTINVKAAAPSILATLCDSLNVNCPIGTWGLPATPSPLKATAPAENITNVVTDYCTDSTGVIGSPTPPDYIEQFGDCIDGKCPVVPFPKRKVKPGYSTPICDPDKYEKITCKASEIYYKQVMRLRYGISNCCPEDEEKWLIKKELIDLQALVDPDYICKPLTSCCNQPITSCGCGCNDTLKTCNS